MLKKLFRKLHQHDRKDHYESWYFYHGNLVCIRQYVCSCGFKHFPDALLIATKENMEEARNNILSTNDEGR